MNPAELARRAIEAALVGKRFEPDDETKEKYSKKEACFVTLTKNGNLRGCIGSLVARQELWRDIIENAINAAFNDPRFPHLESSELDNIKIEVSVLTKPRKITYKDVEDLKKKIKGKGVIISYGFHRATYLPQVWNEISDEEYFLSSLCAKAGLEPNLWKSKKLDVEIYDVKKFSE